MTGDKWHSALRKKTSEKSLKRWAPTPQLGPAHPQPWGQFNSPCTENTVFSYLSFVLLHHKTYLVDTRTQKSKLNPSSTSAGWELPFLLLSGCGCCSVHRQSCSVREPNSAFSTNFILNIVDHLAQPDFLSVVFFFNEKDQCLFQLIVI